MQERQESWNKEEKKIIYLSMGKRNIFSKIGKWLICILLFLGIAIVGMEEKQGKKSDFFQIGKEIIKNHFTKQML